MNRLASRKESKIEAVQSVLKARLEGGNIHIGPIDYVPWQKDNKNLFPENGRKALLERAH